GGGSLRVRRAPAPGAAARPCAGRRWPSCFRLARFSPELFVEGHVLGAPDDERHALVDGLGPHVEDPPGAGGRPPARLLDDEGEGGALVKEAELALLVLGVGRVEVDAALYQAPVEVGDQRAGVAKGPRAPPGRGRTIRRR